MGEIIYLELLNYWQWKKPQGWPANYRDRNVSAGLDFTEALWKLCRYSKCVFKSVRWINNSYLSYLLFLTTISGTLQSAFWKNWKFSKDRIGHRILVRLVEMMSWQGGGRKAKKESPGRCWMINVWISAQAGRRKRFHRLIVREQLVLLLKEYFEETLKNLFWKEPRKMDNKLVYFNRKLCSIYVIF